MDRFHQRNPASGTFTLLRNSPGYFAILASFFKLLQSVALLYGKLHLRKFVFDFGSARSVFVFLRSYFLSQSLTLRKRFLWQGAHWLLKSLYIYINFALELLESTISDKSPWDTLRQIAFSLSFDTYAILLPSHHVKHPPLPPKQCCFAEKYLCGLKPTLIRGGGGGKRMIFKRISL